MNLLACPECDLLQRCADRCPTGDGAVACRRCGHVLLRGASGGLDRTLAFTLAAAIVFVLANVFPIVGLNAQGIETSTTLLGTSAILHAQGMTVLALLVFTTTILMPALQLGAMLCMLVPLRFGHAPRALPAMLRLVRATRPWAMAEVFLLGTLVSLAKLAHMADVAPELALWSFGALVVLLACASSSFDARMLWERPPPEAAA